MPAQLLLYYRNGCHLCEQMAASVYPLCDSMNIEVTEIDIDEDPLLVQRFNADVPVLTIINEGEQERILFKHFFDEGKLKEALLQ